MGLVQLYSDKTASSMWCGASVMYRVHAVLLSFSVELRQNFIYNGHTLVRFLPVEYEEYYKSSYGIAERKCSGITTISETLEFVPFKNSIAQTTVLKGREKKTKVVPRGNDQFLMAFHRYNDKGFELIT